MEEGRDGERALHTVLACGLVPMVMVPVGWFIAWRDQSPRRRTLLGIALFDTLLAAALAVALLIAGAPAAAQSRTPPTLGVELDAHYQDAGARIAWVSPSSAADQAGLLRGDVVMAIDGVEVHDWEQLSSAVGDGVSGQTRMLSVRRGAESLELPVTPATGETTSPDVFEPRGGSCSESWVEGAISALWPVALGAVALLALWLRGRRRFPERPHRWIWVLGPIAAAPLAGIGAAWLICERAGGWSVGAALIGLIAQGLALLGIGAFLMRALGDELRAVVGPRLGAMRAAKLAVFYIAAAMTRAAAALWVLFTLAPELQMARDPAVSALIASTDSPLGRILMLLAAVVVAPAAEEVIFRGILLPALAGRMSAAPALLISSALFGMFHIPSHGIGALMPALLGVVFGWARLRTGSITAPILLHAANNLLVTLLAWML